MSNIRCRQVYSILCREFDKNKKKYTGWMHLFKKIFDQYDLKDCTLVFKMYPISYNEFGAFFKTDDKNEIQLFIPKISWAWDRSVSQIDPDDFEEELVKFANKMFDHEYRHYQQFKYLESEGLDYWEYIRRIEKVNYDDRIVELDAKLYSHKKKTSLDLIKLDYYSKWVEEILEEIEDIKMHGNDKDRLMELKDILKKIHPIHVSLVDKLKEFDFGAEAI